ncbi:MAG: 50S ribosomal protein L25 [Patescibacteria group bacterium]|nr:50S ribosomal protein L25 [Patescibacteria group bacterium]MCX7589364.1 50S ribosomal protein L25 [Patescibacteria group bacterium]MDW8279893.1 50S ribosomal protein L25 [bacterium]
MDLKVQIRKNLGKKVKNLRNQGLIPAELYGHNISNMHLVVNFKDFNNVYRQAGESSIINLVIEDDKSKNNIPVLIHDIQRDYLNGNILHIDFYQIKMDEKIRTYVPLKFVGESPAVKNYGGILNKSMLEIEIEALPKDLPHEVEVDVSNLKELGQSIYVRDLKLPKGVRILIDLDNPVATVIAQKEEEAITEPIDISSVKVESEEKKLEREKTKEEQFEK